VVANDSTEKEASRLLRRLERWQIRRRVADTPCPRRHPIDRRRHRREAGFGRGVFETVAIIGWSTGSSRKTVAELHRMERQCQGLCAQAGEGRLRELRLAGLVQSLESRMVTLGSSPITRRQRKPRTELERLLADGNPARKNAKRARSLGPPGSNPSSPPMSRIFCRRAHRRSAGAQRH
jgi:hypothetical protein